MSGVEVSVWVNIGYGLMLAALLTRDILWLRVILMAGQLCLCVFAVQSGVLNAAVWNALFVIINAAQSALVWRERREVRLPDGLETLYQARFRLMRRSEFLRLWNLSTEQRLDNGQLIAADQANDRLYLIADGEVVIRVRGNEMARLGRGAFVAEMSFLTLEPTSADVEVDAPMTCRYWTRAQLDRLSQRHPKLWHKLQAAIGHDLVGKLRAVDMNATMMTHADAG
ncbi:cyclic nucleotide-binding domain-containing protein [bacterium]|nr:cyclic nucleotide-binding domain-containing protein [bacterium]